MLKPLYPEFNAMVLKAVRVLMPQGYDVTNASSTCDTLDKIKLHMANTGRVIVWAGASDNTIFGEPSVNHAFRAWHDWNHIVYNQPFNEQGEYEVMLMQQVQCALVTGGAIDSPQIKLFRKLLECEIMGQVQHLIKTGEFVNNQRQFCIDYMKGFNHEE